MLVCPRWSRSAIRCPPMKPPAPVTRIRSSCMGLSPSVGVVRFVIPVSAQGPGQDAARFSLADCALVDAHQGAIVGLGGVFEVVLLPGLLTHSGQLPVIAREAADLRR